jgi:hypothetical protein
MLHILVLLLGSNSFAESWGDNGLIKIVRGVNHLNIEKWAVVGGYDEQRSTPN